MFDMFWTNQYYMPYKNTIQENFVDFISAYFKHYLLTSTRDSIATISGVTYAVKPPIGIFASSLSMTVVKICNTFIYIYKSMNSRYFY